MRARFTNTHSHVETALAVVSVFAAAVADATVGRSLVSVAVRRFDVDPTSFAVIPVGDDGLDGVICS